MAVVVALQWTRTCHQRQVGHTRNQFPMTIANLEFSKLIFGEDGDDATVITGQRVKWLAD